MIFRSVLTNTGLAGLWVLTWALTVYQASDLAAPRPPPTESDWAESLRASRWIERGANGGLQHVFLRGSPFSRGLAWGKLSGDRLQRQEDSLKEMYEKFMPAHWVRKLFELASARIFNGVQKGLDPAMLEEMWGVSRSAPHGMDYLASPYARQIVYHGLHEVGQMFVDFAPGSMACTFAGLPLRDGNWLVGRTFDFEGGRIFDDEKVLKWVDPGPGQGHRYVSVIWTGMVGVVSGVNEKGLYVSLNAAGSRDFDRFGMPSTLLIAKVLQHAGSADEAIRIFRDTKLMITDIFLVLDSTTRRLVRIEKSAKRIAVEEISGAEATANHLESEVFRDDKFNRIRREKLTSAYRLERGRELIRALAAKKMSSGPEASAALLAILRDKGRNVSGQPLHLGNRRAIDALIASHGVIFDSGRRVLYVTEGPAMSGPLRGYDLTRSFAEWRPVEVTGLPADPLVSRARFEGHRENLARLERAHEAIHRGDCAKGREILGGLAAFEHSDKELEVFRLAECEKDEPGRRSAARRALNLAPAYRDTVEMLERSLK